jgi:beta-phosphoglucomutase-like phosphatase (HAD superfamily)
MGMEPERCKLELIIFDCDGVLVDSEVLSCRCLCEVLATCGIKLDLGEALKLFLGRSTAAVLQHYGAHGRALPDNFQSDLKARVHQAFQFSLQPIPGVGTLLSSLHVPHCVASSSDLDRVSFSLALAAIALHFDDRIYTSQMVARGKPAPDLFLYPRRKCMPNRRELW